MSSAANAYFVYGSKIYHPTTLDRSIKNINMSSTRSVQHKFYPYEIAFDIDKSLNQNQPEQDTGRRRYFFPPSFTN